MLSGMQDYRESFEKFPMKSDIPINCCPICGEKAKLEKEFIPYSWYRYIVRCEECGLSVTTFDFDKTVNSWNRLYASQD